MYQPDTILALKEPRTKGTEGEKDYEPFAYDRVRVVGQSPINHGLASAEWSGPDGQGVIVQPITSFGSTLDEPIGKLRLLYEVESLPEENLIPREAKVRIIDASTSAAGQTPEEVFAEEAPGEKSKDGKRGRTPLENSPLTVPEQEVPSASPLGRVPQPEAGSGE